MDPQAVVLIGMVAAAVASTVSSARVSGVAVELIEGERGEMVDSVGWVEE